MGGRAASEGRRDIGKKGVCPALSRANTNPRLPKAPPVEPDHQRGLQQRATPYLVMRNPDRRRYLHLASSLNTAGSFGCNVIWAVGVTGR